MNKPMTEERLSTIKDITIDSWQIEQIKRLLAELIAEVERCHRLFDGDLLPNERIALSKIGRRGGQSTSLAKVQASRYNGLKGGRPKGSGSGKGSET